MEFFELIKQRYSVRKFDDRKVTDSDFEKILLSMFLFLSKQIGCMILEDFWW